MMKGVFMGKMRRRCQLPCLLILLTGCAAIAPLGAPGTHDGLSRVIDGPYDAVYETSEKVLANLGASIEQQNKDQGTITGAYSPDRTLRQSESLKKLMSGTVQFRIDLSRQDAHQTKVQVVSRKKGLLLAGLGQALAEDQAAFERQFMDDLRVASERFTPPQPQGGAPPTVASSRDENNHRPPPPPPPSDVDKIPSAMIAGKKKPNAYAVIIGISKYRDLPSADYAEQDAETMHNYLVKVMGYPEENIVLRVNERASKTDLEKYFNFWLKNNVTKDAAVFIYYSGHGAPDPTTGDAYMVPFDGDPTYLKTTAYPLKNLYATLNELPTDNIFVLLDSCFSGAGGRSVIAKGTRPMVVTTENPLLASTKAVIMAASQSDQISTVYEDKRHGMMTYFFLKGLGGDADGNKDNSVDLSELYTYVKSHVTSTARKTKNVEQAPQLLPSLDALGPKSKTKLSDLSK